MAWSAVGVFFFFLSWIIRRVGTRLAVGGLGLVLGVTAYFFLAVHRFCLKRGAMRAAWTRGWGGRGFVAFCGRFVSVGNSCGEGFGGE